MRPLDLLQSWVSSPHPCIIQWEPSTRSRDQYWPIRGQETTDLWWHDAQSGKINYLSIFIIKTRLRECWLFLPDLEHLRAPSDVPTPSKPRARNLRNILSHNLGLNVSKYSDWALCPLCLTHLTVTPHSRLRSMLQVKTQYLSNQEWRWRRWQKDGV